MQTLKLFSDMNNEAKKLDGFSFVYATGLLEGWLHSDASAESEGVPDLVRISRMDFSGLNDLLYVYGDGEKAVIPCVMEKYQSKLFLTKKSSYRRAISRIRGQY